MFGFHRNDVMFGPNAMHLAIMNAHREADIANNIRIFINHVILNKDIKKSNFEKLIQNDYISKM
jgi:hypothetical protein